MNSDISTSAIGLALTPSLRRLPVAVLCTVATVLVGHVLAMYGMLYGKRNWDDKAVHYFSAAYLFADHESRHELRNARGQWIAGLSGPRKRRLLNRLRSIHNYLATDLLIAGIRRCVPPAHSGQEGISYAIHVRLALSALMTVALGWLVWVTRKQPLLMILLLAGLSLSATAPPTSLSLLADRPQPDMSPLAYVPRGSANILFMAALVCVAMRRYRAVVVSLALLFLWHLGLAILLLPATLVAIALAWSLDARQIRERVDGLSGLWRGAMGIAIIGILTRGCLAKPSTDLVRLLLPISATLWLWMIRSDNKSAEILRALAMVVGWFLATSQAELLILMHPHTLHWLTEVTGNPLITEIPFRLGAARYWSAVVFTGASTFLVVPEMWKRLRPSLAWPQEFVTAVLAFALAVMALLSAGPQYGWTCARESIPFLIDEGHAVECVSLTADTLQTLDPRNEPVFFLSLAEYLFTRP